MNDENNEATAAEDTKPTKQKRGFALLDRKLVAEIASKGGKAVHAAGTAHQFTQEEARNAGRLGGRATHNKKRANKANAE
jgi:uncharacterized protein